MISFSHIGTYGDNDVWEIEMPDGKRFRYTHGEMVSCSFNPEPFYVGIRCSRSELDRDREIIENHEVK